MASVAKPPLFFLWHTCHMTSEPKFLTHVEERFVELRDGEEGPKETRVQSDALAPVSSNRLDQLVLPDEERGRMPFTKDQFIIKENPSLVQWERELRKFLRNLTPRHGHRVSAAMVFEWATGLRVKDVQNEEKRIRDEGGDPRAGGKTTWRSDLRKLNQLLQGYFGKPYMTYIMGRKVPRAYRVPPGYYIYRHRPRTMTLYAEWAEGVKL